MQRIAVAERSDWKETAAQHGFTFHSVGGVPYWDESACYRFTLEQVETDLEDPTAAIEEMCFAVVERAVSEPAVMARLGIPEDFRRYVAESWRRQERNLYGRLDFSYDGNGPAKLLEYNADTPTALYESAVFQWVWLEEALARGIVPEGCDQFNSLHERLVEAFGRLGIEGTLHLTCVPGSEEDRGTVAYIEDCAKQAGLDTCFLTVDAIGIDPAGRFTDADDRIIATLFKLYPWEWLFAEDFARHIPQSGTTFIEPAWKTVLSNKGLLPLLWEMFEGHPNLLPAWFEDDPKAGSLGDTFVRKPLLSREGGNVEIVRDGQVAQAVSGPYGAEGYIRQAYHPLPQFDGNHAMVGSWLVASQPAGICIREDTSLVTGNNARFLPHVIAAD